MPLSDSDKKLAAAIGFEEFVCDLLQTHTRGNLERLLAVDLDDEFQEADGVSVTVPRQEAERLLKQLQPGLIPHGYRAFRSDPQSDSKVEQTAIVVLKTQDHYSILSMYRTDGWNYDLSPADIIAKLQEWESRCQFQITGAGRDWVELQFDVLPNNICAFAEEIYQFCPDSVEQGVGLTREHEAPEEFKAARQLCPRLSNAMQEYLKEQYMEIWEDVEPEELEKYIEISVMGIRLLAFLLQESKEVFLWWD